MLYRDGVSSISFYDYFISRFEADKNTVKYQGFSWVVFLSILNEVASDYYLFSSNYSLLYEEVFSYLNDLSKKDLKEVTRKNGYENSDKNLIRVWLQKGKIGAIVDSLMIHYESSHAIR